MTPALRNLHYLVMDVSDIIWITSQQCGDDNFYKVQSTCSRKFCLAEGHSSWDAFIQQQIALTMDEFLKNIYTTKWYKLHPMVKAGVRLSDYDKQDWPKISTFFRYACSYEGVFKKTAVNFKTKLNKEISKRNNHYRGHLNKRNIKNINNEFIYRTSNNNYNNNNTEISENLSNRNHGLAKQRGIYNSHSWHILRKST